MTPIWVGVFTFLAVLVAHATSIAGDFSALIPKSGAYQLTIQTRDKKVFDSAKEMYCSDEWSRSAQSSGWKFSLDVPGYGDVGVNSSNSTSASSRAVFCGGRQGDFAGSDKIALYRQQGDAIPANAFLECMRLRVPNGVYSVSGSSVGDDATITIKPNLSQNAFERIMLVGILSGATIKEKLGIAPGTPLIGKSEVAGGCTLTAPQATFVIRTSTGDQLRHPLDLAHDDARVAALDRPPRRQGAA